MKKIDKLLKIAKNKYKENGIYLIMANKISNIWNVILYLKNQEIKQQCQDECCMYDYVDESCKKYGVINNVTFIIDDI